MAATWQVLTMERTLNDSDSGLEGVVNILHWQCTDSTTVGKGDDAVTHNGRCYGTVGLSAPDADSFTGYDSITHDQAVEWAKASLGDEAVAAYEQSIKDQIALSKAPVSATGVPESWA